jgi:hypothetical protein
MVMPVFGLAGVGQLEDNWTYANTCASTSSHGFKVSTPLLFLTDVFITSTENFA